MLVTVTGKLFPLNTWSKFVQLSVEPTKSSGAAKLFLYSVNPGSPVPMRVTACDPDAAPVQLNVYVAVRPSNALPTVGLKNTSRLQATPGNNTKLATQVVPLLGSIGKSPLFPVGVMPVSVILPPDPFSREI